MLLVDVMRPPCETVVKFILPALRALIAKRLIEEHNFSQVVVARKLGTTQAAISQYLRSKRGAKVISELEGLSEIRFLLDDISMELSRENYDPIAVMEKFCKLCTVIRRTGFLCDLHKVKVEFNRECNLCKR